MTEEEIKILMERANEMTDRLTRALCEGENKDNAMTIACMTLATAKFAAGILLEAQKTTGMADIFEEYMKLVNNFMNRTDNEKQIQEIKKRRDQLDKEIKEIKKKIKETKQDLEYQKKKIKKFKQKQMDSLLDSILGKDDIVN